MKMLFIIFLCFCPLQISAQIDNVIEHLQKREQRNVDFCREIAYIPASELSNSLKEELSFLKKYCSTRNEALFPLTRTICRRAIRIAYAQFGGDNREYIKVLETLRDNLWNTGDTIWAATIELECNNVKRLLDNSIERISLFDNNNKFVTAQLSKYKDISASTMEMVWPAAFLFGRNNTAARLLFNAGYNNREDATFSYISLRRSADWYWDEHKDISTLAEIAGSRIFTKTIQDSLARIGELGSLLTYKCDFSKEARIIRRQMVETMDYSKARDVVSAIFYRDLGLEYYIDGKYDWAAYYLKKSVDDFEDSYLYTEEDYHYSVHTNYLLGLIYEKYSDYEQACIQYKKAIKTGSRNDGVISVSTLSAMLAFTKACLKQNKLKTAMSMLGTIEDIFSKEMEYIYDFLIDDGSSYYSYKDCLGSIMVRWLLLCVESKLPRTSYDELSTAYELINKYKLSNMSVFYEYLLMKARCSFLSGDMVDAIEGANLCIRANSSVVNQQVLLDACLLKAKVYSSLGEKKKQISQYCDISDMLKKYTADHILSMASKEKISFTENISSVISEINDSCLAMYKEFPDVAEIIYNNALLTKGLLLQSENTLKNAIYESGNRELIASYESLMEHDNKDVISHLPSFYFDQSVFEATNNESINRYYSEESQNKVNASAIQKKELEVINHPKIVSIISQEKKKFMTSWEDIKANLKTDEAAIEFVKSTTNKFSYGIIISSDHYYAVIVKNSGTPSVVPVDIGKDNNKKNLIQYSKLWTAIKEHIKDVNTIYFSPVGKMHELPIEYATDENGNRVMSEYNIFRMSSTRELIPHTIFKGRNSATIYGGISYNSTVEDLKEDALKYKASIFTQNQKRSARIGMRESGFLLNELAGTKVEAENIAKIIKIERKTEDVSLYVGNRGTEASFKSLDGKGREIIHIGTHGFYTPINNETDDNKNKLLNEELILNFCGLYMAGANNFINGRVQEQRLDDGILTAQEISTMDLRGLDIVSLSACETGLGNITNDGVFGLQRAFKKAGARSILMSLWKVDDNATSFLMIEFYKNWMATKNKYGALQKAINAVRERKEWNHPKYWAAFILLDGYN